MAMKLLATNSGTNQTTMSFTSGIDSTYKLYIFKFYDINPATNSALFSFQANAAGASGYNETMTTTFFTAWQSENGVETLLSYQASFDQAQGTAFQTLVEGVGDGADESCAGTLWLFNPSNTTYVKHFYSRTSEYFEGVYAMDNFAAGYFNTTTAIDYIQFKMNSGNFDGTIKMYGVG